MTMRVPFLLPTLAFFALVLLAACGGDGDGQVEGPPILNPETMVLRIDDVPEDLVLAPGSALHVTNEQSCETAPTDEERQQCVARLDGWGRKDHYQVGYIYSSEEAILTGVQYAFSGVSVYETVDGAIQSFRYSRDKLEQTIAETPDLSPASPGPVGDESTAFIATGMQTFGDEDIAVSAYILDFRRGNTIARVQMNIASDARSDEENLAEIARLAGRVDAHILEAATQASPAASPVATATPAAAP